MIIPPTWSPHLICVLTWPRRGGGRGGQQLSCLGGRRSGSKGQGHMAPATAVTGWLLEDLASFHFFQGKRGREGEGTIWRIRQKR